MKIAIISDIHANLPAFEVVLEDLDNRKPDAIYCLGDLVGYNIWPNEVIQRIRERGIATIAGNHDHKIIKEENIDKIGEASLSKRYAYAIVGEREKKYLMTLPRHIRLTLASADINMLLVHGSPRKIDEYMLEDMDKATALQIMKQANADIICCGHSHKPYHRVIQTVDNGDNRVRHIINAGSVGKPKDGDQRACYTMITVTPEIDKITPDSLSVEFIRVPYDVERAAKAIEKSILPKDYAEALKNGR